MATKAGVWIDHRRAIVVLATDAGKTIKRIASGVERPVHSAGKLNSKHKYTKNDFVAEDNVQHKLMNQLKIFYNDVIACVRDAEQFWSLVLVKPKESSPNSSRAKSFRGRIDELETSDKMTDRQLADKVDLHFAKNTNSKPAIQKATAKTTKNTTSEKRRKKSGR